MRVIIFLLLFSFVSTSVNPDKLPTINITVTKRRHGILHTEIPNNCCVVDFSEAFKIIVYMPKQKKESRIECFKQNWENIISYDLSEVGGSYYAIINKATAFMETEWQCNIILTALKITTRIFNVHVREKGLGSLYINKDNVKSYTTEYTTLNYDKYAVLKYIDGEMAFIECSWYKRNTHSVLISYQHKDEKLEVVDKQKAELYLRLNKEYNNTFLDCKVTENKYNGMISSTIRVYFQIKPTIDVPRFMINDMALTPVGQSSPDYDRSNRTVTFVYDYFDNENVTITTLTRNSSSLSCSNSKAPNQTVKDIKLKTTLRKYNNNLVLTCAVIDNQQQNNVTITLKLNHVEPNEFNSMPGLSWANILAKYKKGDVHNVIKYAYRGNSLLLTCSVSDTHLRWEFDKNQIISNTVSKGRNEINGMFWEENSFEMKSNYKRSTIKCYEEYSLLTEIELIETGPVLHEDISETDIMDYFYSNQNNIVLSSSVAPNTDSIEKENGNKADIGVIVSSTPTESFPTKINETYFEGDPDEQSFLEKHLRDLLICAIVIVAIIVIAIILCLILKRLRRKLKQQVNNSSEINYENLPEHNNGPMPIPKQWQGEDDDVTYSTPNFEKNIENLYSKPIPKTISSMRKTPIYAEAYDHTNTTGADYTNTGRFIKKMAKKDDSNYSDVYQNIEVNYKNEIKYANIQQINDTYAQVEPKAVRNDKNIVNEKYQFYGNLNKADDQPSTLF